MFLYFMFNYLYYSKFNHVLVPSQQSLTRKIIERILNQWCSYKENG